MNILLREEEGEEEEAEEEEEEEEEEEAEEAEEETELVVKSIVETCRALFKPCRASTF